MSQDPCRLDARLVLGWREWLGLPDLGVPAIRAKVDTGARSSALHVESLETYRREGREWVRFGLHPGEPDDLQAVGCTAEVVDRRRVTDSGGHSTERIFIRTRLALAGELVDAEVNLCDRRNMLFPMLLGRTAMAGRVVVDPDRSFVLGVPLGASPRPGDP